MKLFIIGGLTRTGDEVDRAGEQSRLTEACALLGRSVASPENTVLACSPFEDSADAAVLRGVANIPVEQQPTIEFHFVDSPPVRAAMDRLVTTLGLRKVKPFPHPPPKSDSAEARRFAWLVCQLSALDEASVTFALGGDGDGSANMLMLVAEGRRKPLLPFPFLGGAAKQAFERRRYELEDRLGKDLCSSLQEACSAGNALKLAAALLRQRKAGTQLRVESPLFFISYSRARQQEADHVETVLRRRNLRVFRDEHDFGAGHSLPDAIREAIYAADVFIALWCVEYACSPWCFDEIELALDRKEAGKMELWVFSLDGTRFVPKRMRDRNVLPVKSRLELEGEVIKLIDREMPR
ncbi:MAG: hypothetical protein JWL65_4004 [Gammaproteobacteria bacterium]|nr:hypothetical protein [Gammaproteobacteria bacterium]